MAHTKGPWIKATTNVYSEDNRLCIMIQPARSYQEIGIEELEANARLIAAAPELLNTLKYMVLVWKGLAEEGTIGKRAITMANESIAKAEGKE